MHCEGTVDHPKEGSLGGLEDPLVSDTITSRGGIECHEESRTGARTGNRV